MTANASMIGVPCEGCGTNQAIPGTPFCFTCDPSYPRHLPTATGPGSARVRQIEAPIPEHLCPEYWEIPDSWMAL